MVRILMLLSLVVAATGCRATGSRPIVDMQGVNQAQYNTDLAECRVFVDEVAAGRQVVRGAAGGAVVGGGIGAAVGNSDTAQRGAGAGAVLGAARGARGASEERERVLRNCLRGRGYRVLN